MMRRLSNKITSEGELRNLATLGLRVDEDTVDAQIRNLRYDINEAALAVLKAWKKTKPDNFEAYELLHDALVKVGLANYVNVLKDEWEKTPAVATNSGATPVPTVAAGSASGW